MTERKSELAELKRLRAECLALAKKEDDPAAKRALQQRAASLGADIRIATGQQPHVPRRGAAVA